MLFSMSFWKITIFKTQKKKTFSEPRTSEYLSSNSKTRICKVIFSLISETFDIKPLQPWKYYGNLCVSCEMKKETLRHFLNCNTYEKLPNEKNWEDIQGNCIEKQYEIASIDKVDNWDIWGWPFLNLQATFGQCIPVLKFYCISGIKLIGGSNLGCVKISFWMSAQLTNYRLHVLISGVGW